MRHMKKGLLNFLKNYYLCLVMALFLIVTVLFPGNTSSRILYENVAIAMILATSLSFVVGFLGELSLGHAGFMCIGAYLGGKASALLADAFGKDSFLALIVSLLVGGLVAAVAGFIIGLPALRLKGDYLAIVTLAFGEIVRVLFLNTSSAKINGKQVSFGGAFGLDTPRWSNKTFYIILFLVAILTIAAFQNIIRSKHGRAITSIRDNEIAARATGVNVTRYKLTAFIVSAFFAGVAGVLYSYTQSAVLSTHFDYNYSIDILVMVVFGGMGSLNGAAIAAAAITVLNSKLSILLTDNLAVLQKVIYALILILIVIYTNAPGLCAFREKFNMRTLIGKLSKKNDPSKITNDEGAWGRIPTKIKMNEVLSVDVNPQSKIENQDKEMK